MSDGDAERPVLSDEQLFDMMERDILALHRRWVSHGVSAEAACETLIASCMGALGDTAFVGWIAVSRLAREVYLSMEGSDDQ